MVVRLKMGSCIKMHSAAAAPLTCGRLHGASMQGKFRWHPNRMSGGCPCRNHWNLPCTIATSGHGLVNMTSSYGYDLYVLGGLTLLGAILEHSLHPCSLVYVREALFDTSAVARPNQSTFFESFFGFEIVVPFSYFPRLDLFVP